MINTDNVSNKKENNDNIIPEKMYYTPILRFNEFKKEWDSIKLDDLLEFINTNSLSRSKLNFEEGSVRNIHYGDIHTKFPTLVDCSIEEIPLICPDVDISKFKEKQFCKNGDLIIADASEDYEDIGKSIELINVNEKIVSGLHTILARDKLDRTALGFKGYLFLNESLRKNIKIIANGVSVLGISKNNLAKLEVKLPSFEEQQKIVSFLSAIDKKIILMQKKHKNKVIFKNEFFNNYVSKLQNNDYKKIKLDEFISIQNKRNKNNEDISVLSISNKLGFISQEEQFEDRIIASSDTKNYKIVEKGDFAYNPARINVGSIARLTNFDKGIISPMYIVFKTDSTTINPVFFENYIFTNYFKLEILKRLEGSVRLILSADSLKNIEISVPNINEQQKISEFLELLSKDIYLSEINLKKLKEFKKGLLQKMFV